MSFKKIKLSALVLLLLPLVMMALPQVSIASPPEKGSEIQKRLEKIQVKNQTNKSLTLDELWFLYEMEHPLHDPLAQKNSRLSQFQERLGKNSQCKAKGSF